MEGVVQIIAHRGFSGRQPEMTRAAYAEAIAWVEQTGVPIAMECDVQFSADDQLVCLHDRDRRPHVDEPGSRPRPDRRQP